MAPSPVLRAVASFVVCATVLTVAHDANAQQRKIGGEVSVPRHLEDDEEHALPISKLLQHGKLLFSANWTEQEGAGRPLNKGTGKQLTDPSAPLIGGRAFNRISGPDANSCAGCHNLPFLTKRLWGCANEPPFFHHGLFTTLRQSVLGHNGEALGERRAFQTLTEYEQDSLIEFLKTLQVLPSGTGYLVVDEKFQPREWPPSAPSASYPQKR